MALSDREQQMFDEIESALNEDAEFTKSVREVSNPSQKHAHHTQHATAWGWTLIAVGVVLLFAGFFVKIAGFPLLSLVGFVMMFLGSIMLIQHSDRGPQEETRKPARKQKKSAQKGLADDARQQPRRHGSGSGLADSFRHRFDD